MLYTLLVGRPPFDVSSKSKSVFRLNVQDTQVLSVGCIYIGFLSVYRSLLSTIGILCLLLLLDGWCEKHSEQSCECRL